MIPYSCQKKKVCSFISVRGVTLLELLIASALGIAIMTGVAIYQSDMFVLSDEIISELRQDLAHNRVHDIIESSVNLAGFVPAKYIGSDKSLIFPETEVFAAGEVVQVETVSGNSVLRLRMLSEDANPLKTCLGTRYPDSRFVDITYKIDEENNLICETNAVLVFDITQIENNSGIISRNLTDFRVTLFGENEDGEKKEVQFSKANDLATIKNIVIELVTINSQKIASPKRASKITFFSGDEERYTNGYFRSHS